MTVPPSPTGATKPSPSPLSVTRSGQVQPAPRDAGPARARPRAAVTGSRRRHPRPQARLRARVPARGGADPRRRGRCPPQRGAPGRAARRHRPPWCSSTASPTRAARPASTPSPTCWPGRCTWWCPTSAATAGPAAPARWASRSRSTWPRRSPPPRPGCPSSPSGSAWEAPPSCCTPGCSGASPAWSPSARRRGPGRGTRRSTRRVRWYATTRAGRTVLQRVLRTRIADHCEAVPDARDLAAAIAPAFTLVVADPADHYFSEEHPRQHLRVGQRAQGPLAAPGHRPRHRAAPAVVRVPAAGLPGRATFDPVRACQLASGRSCPFPWTRSARAIPRPRSWTPSRSAPTWKPPTTPTRRTPRDGSPRRCSR